MNREHFLHLVALARAYIIIIKVNHIRAPVAISILGKQRCIGCHLDHIAIALHIAEVDSLCQGIVERILATGGILAEIYLRLLAVVTIVIVLMIDKPARLLIVMLIDSINESLVLLGYLPTLHIVG